MKRITTPELNQHAIESLGLDPSSLDLTTVEGAAGALRRAAGFLCPCSQAELTGQVAQSMQDIVKDSATQTELIESTLEALIAYGDLVESRAVALDQPNNPTTLLYLTPPTFVARNDGSIFLLGIAPDDFSPLPADYAKRIEYDGHVRRISAQADESLPSCLSEFGFFELSMEQWLRTPPPEPATHHLLRLNDVVSRAAAAGSIADIRCDPKPVCSSRDVPRPGAPTCGVTSRSKTVRSQNSSIFPNSRNGGGRVMKRGGCKPPSTPAISHLRTIEFARAQRDRHPYSTFSLPSHSGLSEDGTS